jgi:predicted phage terminase large subunit-like protein
VIIVDDPMKADEAFSDAERTRANAWARHTLFTRLNNKARDKIIIVQQRLHEDDMIGHVLEIANFELISFSAIAQEDEVHLIRTPFGALRHERKAGEALHPQREPLAVLEKQRMLLGTEFFAAQYLQSPTPPGGGLVKTAWFNRYDLADKPRFQRIVQSWDTASRASQLADYSVCTTWGTTAKKEIYLVHVFRQRLEYPELKRKVKELADEFRAGAVLIEDTASGIQLVQELKFGGLPHITPIKPQGDKVMRLQAQTATIEAGRVWIPREAHWLPDFLHELAMFPKGRHDDQVDSTAQALAYIGRPNSADMWFEYYRQRELKSYGIDPEQVTVTFDHPNPDVTFRVSSGRDISRDSDGFYHCTPGEWESLRAFNEVKLIDGL